MDGANGTLHDNSISRFTLATTPTMQLLLSTFVLVALSSLQQTQVDAWPKFTSSVPGGRLVEFSRLDIGHREGNMLLNKFGRAFNVDRNWTKELCQADSDGDGQTNGEELGDPCCVWTPGTNASRIVGLSNPGNKSSTADPSLWKDIDCTKVVQEASLAAAQPAESSTTTSASTAQTVAVAASILLATVAYLN